uniref:F-box/kelch-repeat protein SKIP6 n=1 Tax=Noccaea caerulescens TaxID=107243 RepID=A0A1J3GTC6_NOCCA
MKGRKASAIPIRGCSELKLKTKKKETEVCGLWSVPDDVFWDCLTRVSRLDLVGLAMVSKRHRSVAASRELTDKRYRRRSVEPYLYVFMQLYPDPTPGWFVLHPVQRRLKEVNLYGVPVEGSCFVRTRRGIYTIGGLMNGKPTSEVTFWDCIEHTLYSVVPMKMARSGASAVLINDGEKEKIYVFGGCWDVADSSNWVEVHDIETGTWELLSVFTPKTPLKIQQSVAMDEKHVYAVDEDGQCFVFSASECKFEADGRTESNPENRHDWLIAAVGAFICRGIGGKVLWRLPDDWEWKEVKGLEELQQQHPGFEIIKLCTFSVERLAIFWEARPQGLLELWYAQFSLTKRKEGEVWEVKGNIEWSGPVLSDSSYTGLNLLCAGSLYL